MNSDLAISEYAIGNHAGSMIFQTCTESYSISSDISNINIKDFICNDYVPKVIIHSYIIQLHNNSDASCVLTDPWDVTHLFMGHDLHSIRTRYVMKPIYDSSNNFTLNGQNGSIHITINYYLIDSIQCPQNIEHSRECSLAIHPTSSPRTVNEMKWDVYYLNLSRVEQRVIIPSGFYTGASFLFDKNGIDASFSIHNSLYSISDISDVLAFSSVLNGESECKIQLTNDIHMDVKCTMHLFYSTTSLNYSTFSSRYYKDNFSCAESHVHFNIHNTSNRKNLPCIYSQSNSITPIHSDHFHSVFCEHIYDSSNVNLTNSYIYGYIDLNDLNSVHIVNASEMHLSTTSEDGLNICVFMSKTS